MTTIPASDLVQVIPGVLGTAPGALDLVGLILTKNARVPIGSVVSLGKSDVANYFGPSSAEAAGAAIYFNGFDNSNVKPGLILFAQYPATAVAAWLRGGSAAGLTLAELQAINGTLSVTVNGSEQSGPVNLGAAPSPSAAASLIEAALNTATSATGSVAANVVVGRIDPNVGTGSINDTTLTISGITTGAFAAGQSVSGIGVVPGTTIVSQLTGSPLGGNGTYQVSVSQIVGSTTITGSGGCLNVSAVTTGTLVVGQTLTGGAASGTEITVAITGTGGTGKYAVSISQTVAPATPITANGGTLNVTVVAAGSFGIGDVFTGTGVSANNTITAFLTGTGNTGTYLCSIGDTAVSTPTIAVVGADVAVSYDSVSGAFLLQSGTTGANSTIGYASGTAAAPLFLSQATGAVTSQGADVASPYAFMDGIVGVTQDWATFMTMFNPDSSGNANKQLFAAWVNDQTDRYAYVCWDTDASPTTTLPATTSMGYLLQQNDSSGTVLIYEPSDLYHAWFFCGAVASIDFNETNGRATLAFKGQSGLTPAVTTSAVAHNLAGNPQVEGSFGNGYNFYGAYSTANQRFVDYQRGTISGPFKWADSYINQIWLNNALQLAILDFMTQVKSFPYNVRGYAMLEQSVTDVIQQGLNFGMYSSGVPLSSSEIAIVNADAGFNIDTILMAQGWYLLIKPANATVRANRGSPPCTLYYVDGQSIQSISLASIAIQ